VAIVPPAGGDTLARMPAREASIHGASTEHAPPTRLLVLRHGQSAWNAAGRWQGRADVPLDREGMLQAAAAAEVLGTFDAIWSSHLQRATLTAQIIAELSGTGPVQIDERLCENDVGPWEGLDRDAVEAGWPGYLEARRRPEGFESYDVAAERMIAALCDIATQHPGGEVLIVSHGGVIGALRRHLGAPDERFPNLGGGWVVARHPLGLQLGDRVALLEALPVSEIL
jgi:broad specificity phosphatase PhoE